MNVLVFMWHQGRKDLQIIFLGSRAVVCKFAEMLKCVKIHSNDVDTLGNPSCHRIACFGIAQTVTKAHRLFCFLFLQIGMENELIPKADVNAQVELLNGHLAQLRKILPKNPAYLIAEANMSCKFQRHAVGDFVVY